MKTFKKLFWIVLILFTQLYNAQSQFFVKPIKRGENFNNYVKEMNDYYSKNFNGKGSGFKQYMRWKHEMELKVGRNGIIQNYSALNNTARKFAIDRVAKKGAKVQANGAWEDLGPHDYFSSDAVSNSGLGRINCMAFHPTNTNIFWAGTPAGGLWKTTNGGTSWICISNEFASIGISDIAVNYNNPNIIYILTGDGDAGNTSSIGVLKTIDGGLTWKTTGLTFGRNENIYGFTLKMHPTAPDILVVGLQNNGGATFPTLFLTVTGGVNWTPKLFDIPVYDVEFKPGAGNEIYAATYWRVYKSVNTGGTFLPSNIGMPETGARRSLAISPSQPNNVYVLIGAAPVDGIPAAGAFGGLFKSTNSGANYTTQSTTPNILGRGNSGEGSDQQNWYDLAMAVDPANDARVIVGSINCWKSDNNGLTGSWSRETRGDRSAGAVDPFVHNDFHNVYFRGTRIYVTTDGGIAYSDDYGNSWGETTAGISPMQFYHIDVHNDSYIGGTQDNGANEGTFGNMQTHNIDGGDDFGCIWHTGDHTIQFLSGYSRILRRQFGSNPPIFSEENGFWFSELTMAIGDPNYLFLMYQGNKLMRGNQASIISSDWSWYNTNTAPSLTEGAGITGYAQGTNNTNVMYVTSAFEIIRTSNVHNLAPPNLPTWVVKTNPYPAGYISNVEVDPANADHVWITYSGYFAGQKVFKSINGGNNWTNVSGTLPNVPIRCLVYDSPGSDKIYLGTEIGVFYRSGTMPDWEFYSNNMPNVPVTDLKIQGTYVYAGTFGRGIWRSPINTACPPALTLIPIMEPNPGTQVHSASISVTSTRLYPGSIGTNIYYNGGNYVDLKPGFEIKTDAFLEVKNKGCPE